MSLKFAAQSSRLFMRMLRRQGRSRGKWFQVRHACIDGWCGSWGASRRFDCQLMFSKQSKADQGGVTGPVSHCVDHDRITDHLFEQRGKHHN